MTINCNYNAVSVTTMCCENVLKLMSTEYVHTCLCILLCSVSITLKITWYHSPQQINSCNMISNTRIIQLQYAQAYENICFCQICCTSAI